MSYPPAPWKLQGYAIASLHLLNIDRVRHLIPSELEIISACGLVKHLVVCICLIMVLGQCWSTAN